MMEQIVDPVADQLAIEVMADIIKTGTEIAARRIAETHLPHLAPVSHIEQGELPVEQA